MEGSGVVKEEIREVSSFHGIAVSGPFETELSEGEFEVKLQGDDNLLPLISTQVEDGALRIRCEESFASKQGITVFVSLPELSSIHLVGSGSVKGRSTFSGAELSLSNGGSGDLELSGAFDKLVVNASGSGDIALSGTVQEQAINLSGSGDYEAQSLECTGDATVNLNGSGNCTVKVAGELNVQLTGSGNVLYEGSPGSVNSNVSGSGSVSQL